MAAHSPLSTLLPAKTHHPHRACNSFPNAQAIAQLSPLPGKFPERLHTWLLPTHHLRVHCSLCSWTSPSTFFRCPVEPLNSIGLLFSLCSQPLAFDYFLSRALLSLVRGEEAAPLLRPNMGPSLTHLFPGICRNLKSIVVQIGIADYFKEPNSPEAQKLFEDMVTKLQVRNWLGGQPRSQVVSLGWGW